MKFPNQDTVQNGLQNYQEMLQLSQKLKTQQDFLKNIQENTLKDLNKKERNIQRNLQEDFEQTKLTILNDENALLLRLKKILQK